MPDFKPLPKPVSLQKPVRRAQEQKPPVKKPAVRADKPQVAQQPHTVRSVQKPVRQDVEPAAPSGRKQPYVPRRARSMKENRPSALRQEGSKIFVFLQRRSSRILGLGAASLLAVVLILLLTWSAAGNNAFSISLGDYHFAYIAFSQELNEALITDEALNRLQARENAQVLVNERITLTPANTNQRNILSYNEAIERLAASLTFRIVGTAIELNGERVAVLRSQSEVDNLFNRLKSPFMIASPEHYYSVEFVEDFNLTSVIIDESEISSIEAVLSRLDNNMTVMEEYTVQSGDTLGAIALRHNTTLAQLYEDNPGFTPATILRVGDRLSIRTTRPYLSVRTIEQITRTETIPIVIEYLENPGESTGFSQVLPGREGAEGQRELIIHITRINGIQSGQEQVISSRVTREMEPRVVEIGTG